MRRLTPLRLATDGRTLTGGTGVATYSRELGRAQASLSKDAFVLVDTAFPESKKTAPKPRFFRWMRALSPSARRAFEADNGLFVAPDVFRTAQVYFNIHRRLMNVQLPGPPGIMHWSYPVPLRAVGWYNLYTVHDAIPLSQPELSPIDEQRHRRLVNLVARSATKLVTVSEAAQSDIASALDLPPNLLVNCSEAVQPELPGQSLPEGLRAKNYLLAIGSVEKRKNIARLCEAYRRSRITIPLVIAGPDGWGATDLAGYLADDHILRLPYLQRESVIALIANANALIMPSLAEGFGLPIVEAMALGTPVITSNHGALAEIVGAAALLVDPLDVEALSAAIRQIVADQSRRTKLIEAGRVNALRFTREHFASRLETLYREVSMMPMRN